MSNEPIKIVSGLYQNLFNSIPGDLKSAINDTGDEPDI